MITPISADEFAEIQLFINGKAETCLQSCIVCTISLIFFLLFVFLFK